MNSTRKITKFHVCENHAGFFAGTGRRRTAEIFGEGGPGYGRPCSGPGCHIQPGTDLFWAGVCDRRYSCVDAGHPFSWAVNQDRLTVTV